MFIAFFYMVLFLTHVQLLRSNDNVERAKENGWYHNLGWIDLSEAH